MYIARPCDDRGGGDDQGDGERPIQEVFRIVVLGLDDRSDGSPLNAVSVLADSNCAGRFLHRRGVEDHRASAGN